MDTAHQTDTFTHDGKEYDLGKVRVMVRDKKAFLLPIKDLLWVLKYDKPDEERLKKAKWRWPLLVTRWKGKWAVVDGLHRLEKYRRRGISVIPVKEVTKEMLDKAKINSSS